MFAAKYIRASWRKKALGQLVSFIYMIPVLVFVLCTNIMLLLPTVSNVLFYKNAAYSYSYQMPCVTFSVADRQNIPNETALSYIKGENTGKGTGALLYNEKTIINAHKSAQYDNSSFVRLYVAEYATNLENTVFNSKNFIKCKAVDSKMPRVYITYNTAKYLEVRVGDTVEVCFDTRGSVHSDCIIAGLIKPEYNGTNNDTPAEYSKYSDFMALVVADEQLLDEIVNKSGQNMNVVVFSDSEIEFGDSESGTVEKKSKADTVQEFHAAFRNKTFLKKAVFQLAASLIAVIAVLEMECNFTKKRHKTDIIIFSMLGMKSKTAKQIIFVQILIKVVVSVTAAVLISDFVYFNLISNVYCEPALILSLAGIYIIIGILYAAVVGGNTHGIYRI